jgi:hypothetical protein
MSKSKNMGSLFWAFWQPVWSWPPAASLQPESDYYSSDATALRALSSTPRPKAGLETGVWEMSTKCKPSWPNTVNPSPIFPRPLTWTDSMTTPSSLASAMTYNELGLVKNSYDGAYGYGETPWPIIDMNDEGVAMLAGQHLSPPEALPKPTRKPSRPSSTQAMKGWEYAVEQHRRSRRDRLRFRLLSVAQSTRPTWPKK